LENLFCYARDDTLQLIAVYVRALHPPQIQREIGDEEEMGLTIIVNVFPLPV